MPPTSGPFHPDAVGPPCLFPGVLKAVDHINTTIAPALISSVRPTLCWGPGKGGWAGALVGRTTVLKESWIRGEGIQGRKVHLLGIMVTKEGWEDSFTTPCPFGVQVL